MYFQIKEIILWSRKEGVPPRRLPFQLGKVNVISGASRTGKSAVIPIIDYCLGANSCAIPVKTIRSACSWFGVIVVTENGEKLFARREPGAQRATDDMFVLESRSIGELPATIAKNANADNVRRMLDEIAGLSGLDFSGGESQSCFDGRPSFRDLSAFVLQPQNVVANPDVLFFKTNSYEHREKLRKIFPYILNAITPSLLAKQHELGRLQKELKRKEREKAEAEDVSARWVAELRAKVTEASELGLIRSQTPDLTREQMIALLEEIVQRTDLTLEVTSTTISEALGELTALENEESQVSHMLTGLRRRLADMNRVRESTASYDGAVRIQRDRLQIADWLVRHEEGDEQCPICGGAMQPAADKLSELRSALHEIEVAAGDTGEVPAAFDRELQRVHAEVTETAEKLKAIQIRKRALTQRSEEAHTHQYQAQKVERFVGNLENALDLHRRLGHDEALNSEIIVLRDRVTRLQEELRGENIEERKRRALRIVNSNAARMLPDLDTERPNDPISLQIDDLTIKVTGNERDDYLSEIGSGSNWLAYHIAVMLGLQQFFLSLDRSPVPGFLIMDQPSQVYFPQKVTVREDEVPEEPQFRDEDVDAVQKAFHVMGNVTAAAKDRLQIIVLDHAPRSVWGGIPNVVEVEEWRDGRKLVPMEWLT